MHKKKCGVWNCSLNGMLFKHLQLAYSFPKKHDKIGNICHSKHYIICGGIGKYNIFVCPGWIVIKL